MQLVKFGSYFLCVRIILCVSSLVLWLECINGLRFSVSNILLNFLLSAVLLAVILKFLMVWISFIILLLKCVMCGCGVVLLCFSL